MAHGITTMQGQPSASGSCINWGVRNADGYHNCGYDHMTGTIASVRDINDLQAATYMEYFTRAVDPITRFHVHMAEGISGNNITDEFDSFAGRDPRSNRHAGTSLLYNGTSVLIHSVPLTEVQLQEVLSTNSKIVWSPSSNMALYGATAPIQRILQLGISVSLAPDWTISGEDDMLAELRFARTYGIIQNIPELTSQKLWEMSTWMAAEVVGLQVHIGRLEAGYRADLAVFGRAGTNPYDALIDSTATDVRLVLINGVGFYGDTNLQAATARNAYCENLDACGVNKYLCTQDSPAGTNRTNETYEDIRTQLYNILEGIGYPADEQYGRGDELLPLWTCQ
jgi:cytosine/adenosine deaminase-related metal-dependent hydrolase